MDQFIAVFFSALGMALLFSTFAYFCISRSGLGARQKRALFGKLVLTNQVLLLGFSAAGLNNDGWLFVPGLLTFLAGRFVFTKQTPTP